MDTFKWRFIKTSIFTYSWETGAKSAAVHNCSSQFSSIHKSVPLCPNVYCPFSYFSWHEVFPSLWFLFCRSASAVWHLTSELFFASAWISILRLKDQCSLLVLQYCSQGISMPDLQLHKCHFSLFLSNFRNTVACWILWRTINLFFKKGKKDLTFKLYIHNIASENRNYLYLYLDDLHSLILRILLYKFWNFPLQSWSSKECHPQDPGFEGKLHNKKQQR